MSVVSLRRADREDKRELILEEASAQFNERGFSDVRLEDIGDALGATKASISYHFQSKAALLEAAYMRSCEVLGDLLEEAEHAGGGITGLATWVESVAQLHSAALANNRPQLAYLNDLNALESVSRGRIGTRIADQISVIEGFLRDGGAANSSRATAVLFWSMPGWIGPWLSAIPARRHARQIERLVDFFVQGIRANAAWPGSGSLAIADRGADLLFNREERARLKRDAFERAGIRCFNERGYAGLSLNAMADELGASRSTFYYTFADKDALLEACARRSQNRILAILDAIDEAPGPILPNIAAGFARLYSEHVSNLEPILRGCIYSSLPRSKNAIAEAEWQGIVARLARLLAQCLSEGSCKDSGLEKFELVMLSVLQNIAMGPGFAELPGGNPYANASAEDYFAPLFMGFAGD